MMLKASMCWASSTSLPRAARISTTCVNERVISCFCMESTSQFKSKKDQTRAVGVEERIRVEIEAHPCIDVWMHCNLRFMIMDYEQKVHFTEHMRSDVYLEI